MRNCPGGHPVCSLSLSRHHRLYMSQFSLSRPQYWHQGSGLLLFLTWHLDNFFALLPRGEWWVWWFWVYFRSDCWMVLPSSLENCRLSILTFLYGLFPYGLWKQTYPSRKYQSLFVNDWIMPSCYHSCLSFVAFFVCQGYCGARVMWDI